MNDQHLVKRLLYKLTHFPVFFGCPDDVSLGYNSDDTDHEAAQIYSGYRGKR